MLPYDSEMLVLFIMTGEEEGKQITHCLLFCLLHYSLSFVHPLFPILKKVHELLIPPQSSSFFLIR